ncbi:MAG: ROK family protein, partial [Bifidobacteriaceae bacterium]|nr:ROK family protein [Bifidobacteriaceae bacterium]
MPSLGRMTHGPGSPHALREANKARILTTVVASGSLTHAQIARRSGLSRASVTNMVRELAAAGEVEVTDVLRAGRRSRLVTATGRPGYVLGLDLGRTHVRAAIADRTHQIHAEVEDRMPPEANVSEGVRLAIDTYAKARGIAGIRTEDVLAAAVGLPGPVDQVTGTIGAGTLLPKWTGVNVVAAFGEALNLPVRVE